MKTPSLCGVLLISALLFLPSFFSSLKNGQNWGCASVAQNNVGIGTLTPDSSAILELQSTGKGLLIPRVNLQSVTDVATIPSPALSLLVFNTNAAMSGGSGIGFYYWNGIQWIQALGPTGAQGPAGTAGANGINCWDINSNGINDLSEDINSDGSWNTFDCKGDTGAAGAQGAQGPAGTAGATGVNGINCWDINSNGINDLSEDINSDGSWNTLDCKGDTGATGPAGPVGCTNANYVLKSNGSSAVCSQIFDDGTNVGIGTTNPAVKLQINSGTNTEFLRMDRGAGSPFQIFFGDNLGGTTNATGVAYFDIVGPGTENFVFGGHINPDSDANRDCGTITKSWGNVYAYNYPGPSDKRKKENIEPLEYGLNEVMKLKPVSFIWKKFPDWGNQLGFIAQEVQTVLPELVKEGNDAEKSLTMDYTKLIPVLVKAMQQQQKIIEELKSENETVKTENAELSERVKKIELLIGAGANKKQLK